MKAQILISKSAPDNRAQRLAEITQRVELRTSALELGCPLPLSIGRSLISVSGPFLLMLGFCFCLLLSLFLFGFPISLSAQTNPASVEQIPPLRPARDEISPGFWEQHTQDVVLASLIVLIVAGGATWFLVRPKPPILVSPEAHARQELESLSAQPETGLLLSKVSQILRHYFTAAFALPAVESTTAEFCKLIAADKRISEDLARAMSDFLRQCDQRKFAPQPPQLPINAVAEALKLIDATQARLNALSDAEAAEPTS